MDATRNVIRRMLTEHSLDIIRKGKPAEFSIGDGLVLGVEPYAMNSINWMLFHNGEGVGEGHLFHGWDKEFLGVRNASIDSAYRGKGIYGRVLKALSGYYGLPVKSDWQLSPAAERAWEKLGAEFDGASWWFRPNKIDEAVAASDVKIYKADSIESAEFYFELGHGNDMYHVSEFDLEFTDPMSHEIWVLVHGQVERHQQVREDQLDFDPNDEDAMREYFEKDSELPTWTHNQIWNYLTPSVDDYWKGHYEGDTGRLSVVNPGQYKLTNQLLGLLRSEFSPKEIHVFE